MKFPTPLLLAAALALGATTAAFGQQQPAPGTEPHADAGHGTPCRWRPGRGHRPQEVRLEAGQVHQQAAGAGHRAACGRCAGGEAEAVGLSSGPEAQKGRFVRSVPLGTWSG